MKKEFVERGDGYSDTVAKIERITSRSITYDYSLILGEEKYLSTYVNRTKIFGLSEFDV